MNTKFDLIYENVLFSLRENNQTGVMTFEDNLRGLLKALQDKQYLTSGNDVIEKLITNSKQADPDKFNTAEFILRTDDSSIPSIKIKASQISTSLNDPGNFSVTVFNKNTGDSKEFQNTVGETLVTDVLDYVRTTAIAAAAPEAAVEELPVENSENDSALPK